MLNELSYAIEVTMIALTPSISSFALDGQALPAPLVCSAWISALEEGSSNSISWLRRRVVAPGHPRTSARSSVDSGDTRTRFNFFMLKLRRRGETFHSIRMESTRDLAGYTCVSVNEMGAALNRT